MNSRFIAVMALLLIFSGITQAQRYYIAKEQFVEFISEAPLERINAESEKLSGVLDLQTREFFFKVPMRSFYGFNSPLQRTHFNENYVESDQYPDGRFQGKIIEEIPFSETGTYTIRAKGKLEIHGISKVQKVKCKLKILNNKIRVSAEFKVYLNDYGIKIPRVVSRKLSEEILVKTEVTMTPKKQ